MRSVSVVVPTIGRPESLRLTLDSIVRQVYPVNELIVADASGEPDTRDLLMMVEPALPGCSVKWIRVESPNAAAQRDLAIRASKSDFVFLVDDDVVLEDECLEELVRSMSHGNDIVAACASFADADWPMPARLWRGYLRLVHRVRDGDWQGRVIGPLLRYGYHPMPTTDVPMEWVGGGNTLVRRESYLEVGGFSRFFLHPSTINEDVDLGIKLSRIGKVVLSPRALIRHERSAVRRSGERRSAEDDIYNRYQIMRQTQGRSSINAMSLLMTYFLVETASSIYSRVLGSDVSAFQLLIGRLSGLFKLARRKID